MKKLKRSDVLNNVSSKRSYLKFMYQNSYKEWNGNFTDDRGLFCNYYEELNEMLDDLEKCRCISMIVAYNQYEDKHIKTMNSIQKRFTVKKH